MLKQKLLVLLIMFSPSSFSLLTYQSEAGMAKVQKIEEKEIYLFSEPVRSYKVVEDYNNSRNVIPSCTLRNLVDSYIKRGKKDKVNFDALYMDVSENIYLIKFINSETESK